MMRKKLVTPSVFVLQFFLVVLMFFWLARLPLDFWETRSFDLCLYKLIFHRECLGCGTLRALTLMAHGRFLAAWWANPLVYWWVVLLGVVEGHLGARVWRGKRGKNGKIVED